MRACMCMRTHTYTHAHKTKLLLRDPIHQPPCYKSTILTVSLLSSLIYINITSTVPILAQLVLLWSIPFSVWIYFPNTILVKTFYPSVVLLSCHSSSGLFFFPSPILPDLLILPHSWWLIITGFHKPVPFCLTSQPAVSSSFSSRIIIKACCIIITAFYYFTIVLAISSSRLLLHRHSCCILITPYHHHGLTVLHHNSCHIIIMAFYYFVITFAISSSRPSITSL